RFSRIRHLFPFQQNTTFENISVDPQSRRNAIYEDRFVKWGSSYRMVILGDVRSSGSLNHLFGIVHRRAVAIPHRPKDALLTLSRVEGCLRSPGAAQGRPHVPV
ncbi:MAG: hypothetical protein KDF49_06520, partial [Nitrosomonas sp.]|nr:hypothetical protein [Nitrosomonas sp.]